MASEPTRAASRAETSYVSLVEAARIYGVSVDTLRRRISTGELPAVKSGYKLIRVRLSDLDKVFRPIPTTSRDHYAYRW